MKIFQYFMLQQNNAKVRHDEIAKVVTYMTADIRVSYH